jgi:polyhydroxyalkanoate synthesis regulator protein
MRKILLALIAALILSCASGFRASAQDFGSQKQAVKVRHKLERNALKAKQRMVKQSLRGQGVTRGQRLQMKHQMERERRELRERQQDELQNLKDQLRIVKESQQRTF